MVDVDLKKLSLNRIFWSVVTASFAFSILLFNIAMASIDASVESTNNAIQANSKAIQITNTDIKQILIDTSYIRGFVESNSLVNNMGK